MLTRLTFKKVIIYSIILVITGICNLLIKLVPFKQLIRLISNSETEHFTVLQPKQESRIFAIRRAVFVVSRYSPWRSMCFEQALTASFLLKLLRISHTICFGLNNEGAKLVAHSWVTVNDIIITGYNTKTEFSTVSLFHYSAKDR